jgi:RNA polymerase sigma-70 factor (ECF subfamily)
VQLYDQLLARWPSPIVALHRAVAVAEVDGPAAALPLLDALPATGPRGLADHRPFHAARASLLARLGRRAEAIAAYDAAMACPGNDAGRASLARDRDALLDG